VNQTLIDVCLYFVLNPGEEAYLARIVEGTGKVLIQVQRTLKRLIDCGLVLKTSKHKKNTYKLDNTHIAYEEIRNLALKAKIFSETFERDLKELQNKVDYGFIYGSVAKGTNTSQSDIDLFFVGNLTYEDVSPFIFKLGRELVQEVNVVLFTPRELEKLIEEKNAFIDSVLKESKIWLFGEKSEFEKTYC
jgi:predicted nucleotidyltransferase